MAAAACTKPHPTLSAEEARFIVEPYFDEIRDAFLASGFGRAERVRLDIQKSAHDRARHFAAARDDGQLILVAPEAAALPEDNLVGILSHEFGHACDFAYPARFQLRDRQLVEWDHPDWGTRKAGMEMDARTSYARRKQWEGRDDDEVERTADAIAERVMRRTIFYRGDCLLQSFEGGIAPRPVGLR